MRGCGLRLLRDGQRYCCERGHSFDIARSGYLNLLQPQDRRSGSPGDSAKAVAARRRLHDRGVTSAAAIAIRELLGPQEELLDVGCGDGFFLNACRADSGSGIDISTPAVDAAARRYPEAFWVAANADRALPWADATFSALISITARMNPTEFRRVLRPEGRLLIAVPAPDDLIELRGQGRDRAQRTVEEFSPLFALAQQRRATSTADLDEAGVDDVLHSVYRPLRSEPARAMRLTFSLDLLLFRAT